MHQRSKPAKSIYKLFRLIWQGGFSPSHPLSARLKTWIVDTLSDRWFGDRRVSFLNLVCAYLLWRLWPGFREA